MFIICICIIIVVETISLAMVYVLVGSAAPIVFFGWVMSRQMTYKVFCFAID